MKNQFEETVSLIKELEENIENYKKDYAILIAEVQNIKGEMTKVVEKVTRSQELLKNLSSERYRWEEGSKNFKEQMNCLFGDVLLSSAFLTYIGFFDHYYRMFLLSEWKFFIEQSFLKYRAEMSFIEFLSKPTERLQWTANQLPNDNLCVENAIVLSRYNRYPLVIDPSGQALTYILNNY